MTYEARDVDQIREVPDTYLAEQFDKPALDDVDMLGAIVAATSRTLAEWQEQSLERVSQQSKLISATDEELTLRAEELGVERRDAVRATGVVKFSRDSAATTDYTIPSGTRVTTDDGEVTFETTESVTLSQGNTSVLANARARDGGVGGNLAANKLTTLPSPPLGVESVTNPDPTGDEQVTDTDGNTLVPGQDRETDDQLRERTLASRSIGGAATVGAIETVVRDVDGVRSVSVFPNPNDSTDANGLPPYSNEVVVSGGNENDIADALKDAVSVTELYRLQGGIIGNGESISTYVSTLDDTVDIDFSRPIDVTLDITVDISTTNTYAGDETIKDNVVDYVGGESTEGATVIGLGAGEDVYVNRIEDAIVGESEGVQGIATLTFNNNSVTTNGNGVDVISIATEEQAFLDASNISINQV